MIIRRFARSLALVAAIALVAPASALADTVPGTNPVDVYLISAGFSFTDGGTDWSGIAQIEEERISGQRFVSFFFSGSGASRACDAGTPGDPSDDYVGTQRIEFFSTRSTIKELRVANSLAKGEFDVALIGRRVTLDACSGEIVRSKTERHMFELQLRATGTPETSTDVFIVDNGDGTVTEVTQRFTFVAATGRARLDGDPVSVSEASLQHVELIPRQL